MSGEEKKGLHRILLPPHERRAQTSYLQEVLSADSLGFHAYKGKWRDFWAK